MPSDQDLHFLLLGQKKHNESKANSEDPDQMAWMCWLTWIYTVRPWDNSHIPWIKGLNKFQNKLMQTCFTSNVFFNTNVLEIRNLDKA
jgi:hypothetical protein